ncbi:MAG: S16 family serine protease [Candidatus Nezhaarchaeales archaeon]
MDKSFLRCRRASAKTYILLCLLIVSLACNLVLSYILFYKLQYPLENLSKLFTGSGESLKVESPASYVHNVSSIYIVGVASEGGYTYRGVAMKLQGSLIEGEGRVFVSTTPKIGIELQEAAETAFKAAQKFTGVSASNMDLLLMVVGNESIYVVDGPSAGAAIAVLASSLLLNKSIRSDVIITGTIDEYGNIGQVGGIVYKAEAAAKAGAKIFLVPPGQSNDVVYVAEERRIGPFIFTRYYQRLVNVEDYLKSKGYYDVRVIEVSTLKEVFKYFEA